MSDNPWLSGVYAPVDREVEAIDLPVRGAIPPELNGMLVRMGVSPIPPFKEDHHLFEGHGMVHGLTLEGGRATSYRNKWVRTPDVSRRLKETPVEADIDRLDLSNTHVIHFAGKLYGLTETSLPYRLSDDLETEGRDTLGAIEGGFTAHPHVDPETGYMHALGYEIDAMPVTTHYVFRPDGTLFQKSDIALGGPTWIHDFAMTRNHLIVWDLPVQYSQAHAAAGDDLPYAWTDGYHARVGVKPKHGTGDEIRWFDIDPCWVFHPTNAWEEYGEDGKLTAITCDVIRFAKVFDKVRTAPIDSPPQLYRWTLDFSSGKVTQQLIDDRIQEFPRIDDRYWGKKSSFSVTTELFRYSGGSGLITYHEGGASRSWGFENGVSASEGIFVPASADAGEGEGWILSFATDVKHGKSLACVFDATHLDDGPVAEIELPQRAPETFHGSWVPQMDAG